MRVTFLGITNPIGAVLDTRAGYCHPLVRRNGILWSLTQVEAGAFVFLTPSFSRQGAYVALAPLSFLVLQVLVSGVYYWPLPSFRASAYFDAGSYDRRWASSGITNHLDVHKEDGGGLNVSVGLTLRGAVPLTQLRRGPLQLIALNTLWLEHWTFGTYDYYYNQRADAVLARVDVALVNNAAVLLGFPVKRNMSLRVGATDSLSYLPRRGRLAWHQVGALVMLALSRLRPRIPELTPFLRITAYTEHRTRQLTFDWNFLVGAEIALAL